RHRRGRPSPSRSRGDDRGRDTVSGRRMMTPDVRGLPAPTPTFEREADVVVVGAGAAGPSAALAAASGGRRGLLLCKGPLRTGATALAQGGLAAVLDPDDTFDQHATDTLVAGAGLADPSMVRELVADAHTDIAATRRLGSVIH